MKKIIFYSRAGCNKNTTKFKPFFVFNKSLFIISEYIDLIFFVYDGKSFIEISIVSGMVGHRFGEFVSTRKLHKYVKKKKKKK